MAKIMPAHVKPAETVVSAETATAPAAPVVSAPVAPAAPVDPYLARSVKSSSNGF